MASPDPRDLGLDPAHIVGVCELATVSGSGGRPLQAVTTPAGVRVAIPARQAAGDALNALIRTGYQAVPVASGGRGRALLVAGWSPVGLDARLIAMRGVIEHLGAAPAATASAVISRIRRAPGEPPAGQHDNTLAWARARLRTWVADRSGVHAPHDPAIVPADLSNALRLRAAWAVEAVIDDLIERHLRVAGHALTLFGSIRQNASDDWAQHTAVRQAGIAFHLSGPPAPDFLAQDSSAVVRSAGRSQRRARPSRRPGPAGQARGEAERSSAEPGAAPRGATAPGTAPRTAAADLPRMGRAAAPPAKPAAAPPASPGGRRFPARRPGLSP